MGVSDRILYTPCSFPLVLFSRLASRGFTHKKGGRIGFEKNCSKKREKRFFCFPRRDRGAKKNGAEKRGKSNLYSPVAARRWALTQGGGGTSQKKRRREDAHTREGISTISQVCTLVAYIEFVKINCKSHFFLQKRQKCKKTVFRHWRFPSLEKKVF